jgi:hypothetical protein
MLWDHACDDAQSLDTKVFLGANHSKELHADA